MNETNKKLEILRQFGLNENQVGSEMAQVLFSCLRIESLTLHLTPIQLNDSDLEDMTQKGRNIIKSAYFNLFLSSFNILPELFYTDLLLINKEF